MDLEFVEQFLSDMTQGHEIAPGLSNLEVQQTEAKDGFRFPPDLRMLLQVGLPISSGFVNWRGATEDEIRKRLNEPLRGICVDIEHNCFWLDVWGEKPALLQQALDVATAPVRQGPKLIPIHPNCYMPDEPLLAGNPVFSFMQSDIIYYGYDLADFLFNAFDAPDYGQGVYEPKRPPWAARSPRAIRFWDQVMAYRGVGYAGGIFGPKALD